MPAVQLEFPGMVYQHSTLFTTVRTITQVFQRIELIWVAKQKNVAGRPKKWPRIIHLTFKRIVVIISSTPRSSNWLTFRVEIESSDKVCYLFAASGVECSWVSNAEFSVWFFFVCSTCSNSNSAAVIKLTNSGTRGGLTTVIIPGGQYVLFGPSGACMNNRPYHGFRRHLDG